MLEAVLPEFSYDGTIRQRTGNIAYNSAPTNMYACADGALVCIAANTTRLFRTLFRAIGREEYADDPDLGTNKGRVRRAGELDAVIAEWTGTRTADEVVDQLQELQLPVSRINTIADIVADPQFQAREMIVSIEDDRLDEPLLVGYFTQAVEDSGAGSAPCSAARRRQRRRPRDSVMSTELLPTERLLRMLPIT